MVADSIKNDSSERINADRGSEADARDPADALAVDQQRRWSNGERTRVEEYLHSQKLDATDHEALLDLIYNEVLLREQCGERPRWNEYAERFPQVGQQLRELFEVHMALVDTDFGSQRVGGSQEAVPLGGVQLGAGSTVNGSKSPAIVERALPTIPGYEIYEEVGRGGMGIVYRAKHLAMERLVALKVIRSGRLASAAEIERFRKEAAAAAKLDHPNIVPVFDVGEQDDLHFFSMTFVDGETLGERFARGKLSKQAAAELVATLADAIDYAHRQGITHRDLKPQNILIDAEGRPRIVDFGLAKSLDAADAATLSGQLLGTPQYLAPEQASGDSRLIGPITDVYALGTLLYQALTGRVPFATDTLVGLLHQIATSAPLPLRALDRSIERELETICLKCLQKEPEGRYTSAAALADDLRRYMHGKPVLARPLSWIGRTWAWSKRRPAFAGLTAAVVGLILALAIGGTAFSLVLAGKQRAAEQALARSLLQQAKAVRNGRDAGRYFAHQPLVTKSLSLFPRGLPNAHRLEARNELIAGYGTMDMRVADSNGRFHSAAGRLDRRICFSPDSRQFAALEPQDTIAVGLVDDDVVPTKIDASGRILRLRFMDDARLAAIRRESAGRYSIVAWDVADPEKEPTTLLQSTAKISDFSFSRDIETSEPKLVATISRDGLVIRSVGEDDFERRLADGTAVLNEIESGELHRCEFSNRGDKIALYGGSVLVVVDISTMKELARYRHPEQCALLALAWSSDDKLLATGTDVHAGFVWHVSVSDVPLAKLSGRAWFHHIHFMPSGRIVVSGCGNNESQVWNATTGEMMVRTRGYVVDVSEDGDRLVGTSGDQVVGFDWHAEELRTALSPDGSYFESYAAACDPNLSFVAAGSWCGTHVWRWNGEYVGSVGFRGPAAMAISDDARLMLTNHTEFAWYSVSLGDRNSQLTKLGQCKLPVGACGQRMHISRDGQRVCFPGYGVHELVGDQLVRRFAGTERLHPQLLHPSGTTVVCVSEDESALSVYDVDSHVRIGVIPATSATQPLAFCHGGEWLLCGTKASVQMWDIIGRRMLWERATEAVPTVMEHASAGAQSPLLAITGINQPIVLIDISTGQVLASLPDDSGAPWLCLSDDASRLLCAGRDATVCSWDIPELRSRLAEFALDW